LEGYLLRIQTKASQQFRDIAEAQLSVSLAVSDVLKTRTAVMSGVESELKDAMLVLVADCPEEFKSDRLGQIAKDKNGKITVHSLAKLRTKLNVLKDAFKMAQAKVEGTKLLSYTLEDIVAAKNNPASSVIHWSLTDKDSTAWEYTWHITIRPFLLRVAAIICAGLSILSFLGVICSMTGVSNGVSPYFLAIHGDNIRPAGICVFVFITFAYTVNITTWAIFEMKFGAAYELVPGRTTPEALSFNVRMVARLAAPLAFFYLGWIAENGIKTGSWVNNNGPTGYALANVTIAGPNNTNIIVLQNVTTFTPISMPSAFSHFYQLQSINAVQEVFGVVFPIILYVVLGLVAFNFFNRLLVCLKLENYQFGARKKTVNNCFSPINSSDNNSLLLFISSFLVFTEIITDEQLREGKRQLDRNKGTTIRKYRRGETKTKLLSMINKGRESESSESGGERATQRGFSLFAMFTPQKKTEIVKEETFLNEGEGEKQQTLKEPPGNPQNTFNSIQSMNNSYLFILFFFIFSSQWKYGQERSLFPRSRWRLEGNVSE
jgi:hypothetical protein